MQVLSLYYEDGTAVTVADDAKVWISGTEFHVSKHEAGGAGDATVGEVVIPFRSAETCGPLIIGDGSGFAVLCSGFRSVVASSIANFPCTGSICQLSSTYTPLFFTPSSLVTRHLCESYSLSASFHLETETVAANATSSHSKQVVLTLSLLTSAV